MPQRGSQSCAGWHVMGACASYSLEPLPILPLRAQPRCRAHCLPLYLTLTACSRQAVGQRPLHGQQLLTVCQQPCQRGHSKPADRPLASWPRQCRGRDRRVHRKHHRLHPRTRVSGHLGGVTCDLAVRLCRATIACHASQHWPVPGVMHGIPPPIFVAP